MAQALTNDQIMALMQNAPTLDQLSLPPSLQQQLLDLEIRGGKAYNSGTWIGQESGQVIVNPPQPAPTVEEAQQVLGQTYLALKDQQTTVKNVMNEMGLTPSSRCKNPVEKMVDTITGWFR